MLYEVAYAMAAPQGQSAQGSPMAPLVMLGIMFLIMYFLMIRPQQKKMREHENFVKNLNRGDEVITDSGLHGKITGLTDTVATLEVSPDVKIKMDRTRVAARKQQKEDK